MHQSEALSSNIVLRSHIEDAVDRLLVILDRLDGDTDLEDGGDAEPSLGAPEGHDRQVGWMRGSDSDREIEARVSRPRPDVIGRALALLSRPEAWCRGAAARDVAGNRVSPLDPLAISWDIGGAIERAAGCDLDAVEAIDETLHDLVGGVAPTAVNDDVSTTHADIVALLMRAQVSTAAA